MALRMVSLKSSKSGQWIARKGIPADVRAEYKRLYGVGHEAILRVPAGTSKAQAKAQLGQWLAEVETQIAGIRAAAKGEGQPLTKLNALALSGRWYAWFVARHESDPGSPENWADRKEHLTERVWYPHAPAEHLENPNADPSWPWTRWPEVREAVRPEVAEMALAATFLANEGLALTHDASVLFVDAVSEKLFSAYATLEQRANGDYSRDTYPDTFPAYVDRRRGVSTGMSCWDLFGAYVESKKPKPKTIERLRGVFLHLNDVFADKSASSMSEAEARMWGNQKDPKMPQITTAFAPDLVNTMRWALEAASYRVPASSRTPATKAKMAQRIVRSAQEGTRYAHQLVAVAVAEGMVPAL